MKIPEFPDNYNSLILFFKKNEMKLMDKIMKTKKKYKTLKNCPENNKQKRKKRKIKYRKI